MLETVHQGDKVAPQPKVRQDLPGGLLQEFFQRPFLSQHLLQLLPQPVPARKDGGEVEVFFGGKVAVEGALAHPRVQSHLFHEHLVEVFLGKEFGRCLEDYGFFALVFSLSGHNKQSSYKMELTSQFRIT